MTSQEKDDFLYVLRKSLIKLIETHTLIKDGKVVVAYEKLGGVIKILSDFGGKLEVYESKEYPQTDDTSSA